VERWCERVAADALLPAEHVRSLFASLPDGNPFEAVRAVADAFSVSLRAAAIRIGDLELVEDAGALYRMVDQKAVVWDRDKGHGRGKSQDRVARKLSQVGPQVMALYGDALADGYIHERDLRDHLGIDLVEFEEAKIRADLIDTVS
jgi:hypothetical protein